MKAFKFKNVMNDVGLREKTVKEMKDGSIFIYPTDTIYGIGCNAELWHSIDRLRKMKGRGDDKPFSVIAPSIDWILKNTVCSNVARDFMLNMLPGPYTLVLKTKRGLNIPAATEKGTLGVRLPNHPIRELFSEAGVPFVTTSVNIAGEEPADCIGKVPDEIARAVDYAIDDGLIPGPSSRVFDMTGKEISILRY